MKKRLSILCLGLVAILILLFFWHGKKATVETVPQTSEMNANMQNATTVPKKTSLPIHTNRILQRTSSNPVAASGKDKAGLIKQFLAENDSDIVFYGKLEDQFSNAVGNATVNFGVRYENLSGEGVKRGAITANADGSFTISGYRGQDISIVPKKEGYVPLKMEGSGNYSPVYPQEQRAHPDPSNPVIIRMWKLQGPEPLVPVKGHYKIPYTSGPINFDLLAGQIVPTGGDLRITVNRPTGVISGQNKQDWGIQIEAVEGGLIDAAGQERTTFAAPESGYQPTITILASTNGHGVELIQADLFVKSRNGQVYSKVDVSFRINGEPNGPMYINFSGVANTNSSPNWEATAPQSNP